MPVALEAAEAVSAAKAFPVKNSQDAKTMVPKKRNTLAARARL